EDGMRLAGVRAPQEDDVRFLSLAIRAGPAARPEHRRQTDEAGRVSGSIATVDVVFAEDHAAELLGEEIHLVGRSRAAEDSDRVGPALGERLAELSGNAFERLVPGRPAMLAAFADQRCGQPH